jgi:1-acyl-sn-glycerol-3-phosphate acyltransferase
MREHPEVRLHLVDLGSAPNSETIAALARELSESDPDEEVALRGRTRLVRRLRHLPLASLPARAEAAATASEWQAEIGMRGSLATLRLRARPRCEPGPRQVSIRVKAASLNYRDVVLAMGGIPGLEDELSFGQRRLGSDCAGIVTLCGTEVVGLQPGDAVMAMAPGSLASVATTAADLAVPIPKGLDFVSAASVPTAFLTAWYALRQLGQLRRGERVLIHAATGGVGLAAIQIARDLGAQIFATAGSAAKRRHLEGLGIAHVMNSRSLEFADEIREHTGGAGVDLVLNSLAGEAIERGIACLAPYGRFLEIGKRDIYADRPIFLSPFRRNLSYFAIDLDRLSAERPALVGECLRAVAAEFAGGRLTPIVGQNFPVAKLEDAFRLMAQTKHIGKIAISNFEAPGPLQPADHTPVPVRSDATYLVSGGFGGFGLALAEHLGRAGAGAIVLLGRRPPQSNALERLAAMRAAGFRVEAVTGDVADSEQVRAAFAYIDRTLPPLRGVFHAAMVLDDRRIEDLDAASVERVVTPKAQGAWTLHRATEARSLDLFVMFSSITAPLGNPQQANYGAANAFLGALAAHRRAAGLPALTIDWGVLAEIGYVASRPELKEFLEHQGYRSFTTRQALAALDTLICRDVQQIMVADIDWGCLAAYSPRAVASPRLADLIPTGDDRKSAMRSSSGLRAELAAAPQATRRATLTRFLTVAVNRVLGLATDRIEPDRALDEMGLDSLLALELRMLIATDLGVELPVLKLLDGMSIDRLAGIIAAELDLDAPAGGASAIVRVVESPPPASPLSVPDSVVVTTAESNSEPSVVLDSRAERGEGGAEAWSVLQSIARVISRVAFGLIGSVQIDGLECLPARGPYILAVNHLSMADVPLALSILPHRTTMLAAAKLQRRPLLNWLLGDIGHAIFVDKNADMQPALERALSVLRAGGNIALSPEGTRRRTGLIRAQTGMSYLAAHANVPIIPFAAWGQEQWRERFRRLRRLPIRVRIGAAIAAPTPPHTPARLREHTDLVMMALADLLPEQYRGVYADNMTESPRRISAGGAG